MEIWICPGYHSIGANSITESFHSERLLQADAAKEEIRAHARGWPYFTTDNLTDFEVFFDDEMTTNASRDKELNKNVLSKESFEL